MFSSSNVDATTRFFSTPASNRVPVNPGPSWVEFATALEAQMAQDPALKAKVQAAAARTTRAMVAQMDAAVPSTSDVISALSAPTTARGGTVVRAFWWGFHIQISHEDLQQFLSTADPINAVIGTIGGAIPSPAAPFIALAAAFIAGALGILRGLDHGRGVYVSMSWFAPGAFIPTSV